MLEKVTAPEEHLNFRVGTDRKLADWPEIVEYFKKVDDESNRVKVEVLGESTLGNPFLLAVISSPENLQRLEEYRKIQLRLSNPKDLSDEEAKDLIERGKTICMISCSIHSTEVGGSQMSMELLYKLASEESEDVNEVLDKVIFLFVPSLNPDGNRIVVDWYEKYLGTEYEGSGPPYVYHEYAGHDNNRDWYMFNLKETQLTVEHIHNKWHPQIVYDIHQMGQDGPRFFVPPFTDPYEPNIDPVILGGVNFMGTSMADALNRDGKAGVVTHWIFDAWTPARAYQHYHGGIRILSEAASVDIASPIELSPEQLEARRGYNPRETRWNHPLPWKGGRWTLRDIIDYELVASWACLQTAAKFRKRWLRGTYEMGKRSLKPGKPYAFVIPSNQRDLGAVKELLWVLKMGDVEIHRAKESFEVEGVVYPEDSYVVILNQPYGGFAQTLLEKQVYPDLRETKDAPPIVPYDVTAHTLGLQLGVDVVKVESELDTKFERVDEFQIPKGEIYDEGKPYYIFSCVPNYSVKAANKLLFEGYYLARTLESQEVIGQVFKPGAYIVEAKPGIEEHLENLSELGIDFYGMDNPVEEYLDIEKPRVAIYRAWLPNADEGWLRQVLEEYTFEYENLSPQDVKAGDWVDRFDVLIIPDLTDDILVKGMEGQRWLYPKKYERKYREGVGEEGTREILRFLDNGGTVVTLNRASEYAVKSLWAGVELILDGLDEKEFYCPGSILRVIVDDTHPIGFGYSREEAIMFLNSPAFNIKEGTPVAWYPEASPLLSGWILGERHLRGSTAVAEIPAGNGTIIMMGCPPHFRNQMRSTFKLLFNSLFYATT
ncbi:hypothetical protein GF319_15665 [Candidatus Bathyarchaeota archaeon]|nr:hypothetical protein [Candidatus Bathyarchaeota archaeon]